MQNMMEFPNTFDEFAKDYGFTDTDGSELIPVFRVKQWLEHTKEGHWIKMPIGFKCSKCNELEDKTSKCCPNCGARMVKVKGDRE